MPIRSIISKEKSKFRTMQRDKDTAHSVALAKELKQMKEERIRLEGRAKLEKLKEQEQARMKSAKKTIKEHSTARRFSKGLANVINEGKKRAKKSGYKPKGIDFGGTSNSPFK